MRQSLNIGFYLILVAILFFRIYKIVSTECLTAIIAIIILVFVICKSIAEKAIDADYKELIEIYTKNNDKLREENKKLNILIEEQKK